MKEETIYDQTLVNEKFCESQVKQSRKNGNGVKMSAAVFGGAVAGSAATFGGQAVAASIPEGVSVTDESNSPDEIPATTENSTMAAPVAQVNDEMSFSQAFASARQQVGPGGVFSWHGKVYGTYYKEEWDSMSADEKAEYQASVDYDHVPNHEYHNDVAQHTTQTDVSENNNIETQHNKPEADSPYETTHNTSDDSADMDIHVISVEHDVNMNGQNVDVAVIEVDGHQGLLVDVDHDGIVEGAIVDFNDDGQVQEDEISPDLSESQIQMPQMSDGDMYMAMNDDMPDYTNDAMV